LRGLVIEQIRIRPELCVLKHNGQRRVSSV
jgi:hypothetical protein